MKFISLDLEIDRPNTPEEKIIQIGYVIADSENGRLLHTEKLYVKRPDNLEILPFIEELTGITQAQLDEKGMSLEDAYSILLSDIARFNPYKQMVQWGDGDCRFLNEQLGYPENWPFYRRFIDVKTLFIFRSIATERSLRGGLGTACKKLDIPFIGKQHDAEADALNTWRVFYKILKEMKRGLPHD